MKNAYKFIAVGVVALALLIGGHQVKANAGSLLEIIGDKAGYYLAQLIYKGQSAELSQPVAPKSLGGAGDTFSVKRIAQITGTTLTPTSSLENTDAQPRIITKLYGSVSTTAGAPVTSIHFAFSTNTTGAGDLVDLGVSTSLANAALTHFSSSTISPGTLASWNTTTYKYLICYTLVPVSSTVSFCGAEYAQY